MPTIDVIIVVYNRAEVLRLALEALASQAILPGWELRCLVCDDGSEEDIATTVANVSFPPPWKEVKYISQSHQGIAAARNYALQETKAEIIFLLGADILLRPGALKQHLQFHEQNPDPQSATLGFVMWDPRLNPTAFMEWMIHGGPQNDFDSILATKVVDAREYFYASHISLKRSFIGSTKFRLGYEPYGWEDLDMGHALTVKGIKLHAIPQAIGLHHHLYTVKDIYKRQQAVGKSVLHFMAHNTISNPPRLTAWRRLKVGLYVGSGIRLLLQYLIQKYGARHALPRAFAWATTAEFWYGMWKGQKAVKQT